MSRSTLPDTAFASAERDHFRTVETQAALLRRSGPFLWIFSRLPLPVVVVNSGRQIVFANEALLEILGAGESRAILGFRIGEAFGCPNSAHQLGGCGTTVWCRGCGVTTSVIEALEKGEAHCRSRIETELHGERNSLSFEQSAYAFDCGGEQFAVVILKDLRRGGSR